MKPVNLDRVYNFAQDAHAGQFRNDGKTPYFKHPVQVRDLLIQWGVQNENILAAALLHDVLEDTEKTGNDIEAISNKLVLSTVCQLTCYGGSDKKEYIAAFAEFNGYKTTEAVLIKVADRICNTMDFLKDRSDYTTQYWDKGAPIIEGLMTHARECAFGKANPEYLPALQKAWQMVEKVEDLMYAIHHTKNKEKELRLLLP